MRTITPKNLSTPELKAAIERIGVKFGSEVPWQLMPALKEAEAELKRRESDN